MQDEESNQNPIWKSASVSGANTSEVDGPKKGKRPSKVSFPTKKMKETVGSKKEPAKSALKKTVRFEIEDDRPRGMKKSPVGDPHAKKQLADEGKPRGDVSKQVPMVLPSKEKHTLLEKAAVTNQGSSENSRVRSQQPTGNVKKAAVDNTLDPNITARAKRKDRSIVSNIEDNPQFRVSWAEPQPKKAKFNTEPGMHTFFNINSSGLIDQKRRCTFLRLQSK